MDHLQFGRLFSRKMTNFRTEFVESQNFRKSFHLKSNLNFSKALEEKQTKEAVKKYGSKDSGGVLGEILGPLLKKKTKEKK